MGWESRSIGGGRLVYLLALFVVRAAFPNMFLELFHEAVMRNMNGKGGVAGGMRWWGGRHRRGWVPWGYGGCGILLTLDSLSEMLTNSNPSSYPIGCGSSQSCSLLLKSSLPAFGCGGVAR